MCVCLWMRVCARGEHAWVIVRVRLCAHSGLDGRLNRSQVLQLANGIPSTQGGLWRREAKTEAPLLATLYRGWPPPRLQNLICITAGTHPPPLFWPPPYLTANPVSASPSPRSAVPARAPTTHCSHPLSLAKWHVLFSLTQNAPKPGCGSPSFRHCRAVFFLPLSPLQSRSPSFSLPYSPVPLPILLCRRGRGNAGPLSCVLPPGLLSNYCILSSEEKKEEKEEQDCNHLLHQAKVL